MKRTAHFFVAGLALALGIACGDAIQSVVMPDASAQEDGGATEPMVFEVECDQEIVSEDGEWSSRYADVAIPEGKTGADAVVTSCEWSSGVNATYFFYDAPGGLESPKWNPEHLGCGPMPAERVAWNDTTVRVVCKGALGTSPVTSVRVAFR